MTCPDRRPLAGFLGAAGVSALGTKMSFLAVPWLVLTTTGSATLTGLAGFAEMAPYVAVQALGGPLVDRLGAWRVSIAADAVAAAGMGLVPALWAVHLLSLPALAAAVALAGAARGAGDAARDVLVPGVGEIAGARLERTTGLFDGVSRAASLIGLPLAGALVAVTPAASILAVDAGTFAASAVLVAALVPESAQPQARGAPAAGTPAGGTPARGTPAGGTPAGWQAVDGADPTSYLASLAEGFRFLRGDRLLVAMAAMILVTNFVDQAGGAVLFPVWAHDVARSSLALGLLGGAQGLGAVAGNALATWLGPRLPRRMSYAVGFFVGGAPRYLVLALAGSLSPVLAAAFVGGVGLGGINPVIGAVEYERVPRHLQARVLGAVGASAWAGIPFGSLAGGIAVSAAGLRPALLAAGALYGAATLVPFAFPVWRQMDRGAMHRRPGRPLASTGGGTPTLSSRMAGDSRDSQDLMEGSMAHVLGVDIGGTGIKAAPVDLSNGTLLSERVKVDTPHPSEPDAVAASVSELVTGFSWTGPVGITFPGVVIDGVVKTAANVDKTWIDTNAGELFGRVTNLPVTVINDADAAGLAEMTFGAGVGEQGTVLMLTFGTGIGSALFSKGVLVPNTEFGHIEIRGKEAEKRASEIIRESHDLSWGKWAGRVDEYLAHMELLLSPRMIIIGGGVSKRWEKFVPLLTGLRAKVVPAAMFNDAGIVGAAMATDRSGH